MEPIVVLPCQDAYACNRAPRTRFRGRISLQAGRNRAGAVFRSFIQFDLRGLPPGSAADRAELHLPVRRNPPAVRVKLLTLHPVLEAWSEDELSWQDQPACGPAVAVAIPPGEPGAAMTVDLTDQVLAWVSGLHPNHGLMIRAQDERRFSWVKFGSRRRRQPSLRPRLVLLARCEPPLADGRRPRFRSLVQRDAVVPDIPVALFAQDMRFEQLVTYAVYNHGPDAAEVLLQLSPDGTVWIDDPPQFSVRPGEAVTLVPRTFLRFTRVLARAARPSRIARLTIWFQAQAAR